MQRSIIGAAITLVLTSVAAGAQAIPLTVAQAEAEATGFPHADSGAVQQPYFTRRFAGVSDRRCIDSRAVVEQGATRPLRSGDFIVSGYSGGSTELTAGQEHKLLWMPLHIGRGAAGDHTPLTLRADRVGAHGDSLRLTVPALTHTAGRTSRELYGYPSIVRFPTAGRRLVVATAGEDWGCFIVDVA